MSKTRKRTAKERVLARYPGAYLCWNDPVSPDYSITVFVERRISGKHKTRGAAWADAARRLKEPTT